MTGRNVGGVTGQRLEKIVKRAPKPYGLSGRAASLLREKQSAAVVRRPLSNRPYGGFLQRFKRLEPLCFLLWLIQGVRKEMQLKCAAKAL